MKKNKILSIRIINYFLFLAILYNSLLFFVSEKMKEYNIYFFFINFFLLTLFFLLNKLYEKDFKKGKKYMKILNNNIFTKDYNNTQMKDALKWELNFKENKDFFNYFRYSIIKNNILKKDYNDLEKVLLKFTPETFLKDIWKKGNDRIDLWASIEKDLHIMFLDIIWFTRISEKLSPEKALKLLNIYFDWIVEIVKKKWGYVDKFLWDWMMIVFWWKFSDEVIETAIKIDKYIDNLNFHKNKTNISVWIWINSWNVIMWTIWSKNRMEITVIWDVVNIAAKLEWLTRKYDFPIIISNNTYKLINNNILKEKIKEIWLKSIKWRKNKIKIYGINI